MGFFDALIQLVERLARPEGIFEFIGAAVQFAHRRLFLEYDRPAPDRGKHQNHRHAFDDDVGMHEQGHDARLPSKDWPAATASTALLGISVEGIGYSS